MALAYFGEQFAAKTLRKFYATALTPAISNRDFEGEIKKAGDRVNILSFLSDIALRDYSVGSDMTSDSLVDHEDQLVVSRKKYYSFPIDRVETLFTYAGDIEDTLIENASKVLEREIDTYILSFAGQAKAGNWVGVPLRMIGDGGDTAASLATTAAGATLKIDAGSVNGDASIEDIGGNLVYCGFTSADLGRPIRLVSTASWVTDWYKITGITDSVTCSITNWDDATEGSDIPGGDILRRLAGNAENASDPNNDGDTVKPTSSSGFGFEIQAAFGTTVSVSNIFDVITEVAQKLNENDIPDTDRHITLPPGAFKLLQQAAEFQPSGIEALYTSNVVNGRVARVLGFDVHIANAARFSTRVDHAGATGVGGADVVTVTGTQRTQVLANHKSFVTFAYKWAESRVVDAEAQFAKKYQGLHLYGAAVPCLRRAAGVNLLASFD
jgi:hypothetical protein